MKVVTTIFLFLAFTSIVLAECNIEQIEKIEKMRNAGKSWDEIKKEFGAKSEEESEDCEACKDCYAEAKRLWRKYMTSHEEVQEYLNKFSAQLPEYEQNIYNDKFTNIQAGLPDLKTNSWDILFQGTFKDNYENLRDCQRKNEDINETLGQIEEFLRQIRRRFDNRSRSHRPPNRHPGRN